MADIIEKIPREEMVEGFFTKILSSRNACERLSEVFFNHLQEDNLYVDTDATHFSKILFSTYVNRDISGLLLEICQRSMFDLLREAYLIPKRFHGKAGKNPVLLTKADGTLNPSKEIKVSDKVYKKFLKIKNEHMCIERSKIYLAEGYDILRSYTNQMKIQEKLCNGRRGIMILYALPDTEVLGLSEAEAYAVIWDTFCEIQKEVPSALVYYGQDTGENDKQRNDEIGILLPIYLFEKNMLKQLQTLDKIILPCREKMINMAGTDSFNV